VNEFLQKCTAELTADDVLEDNLISQNEFVSFLNKFDSTLVNTTKFNEAPLTLQLAFVFFVCPQPDSVSRDKCLDDLGGIKGAKFGKEVVDSEIQTVARDFCLKITLFLLPETLAPSTEPSVAPSQVPSVVPTPLPTTLSPTTASPTTAIPTTPNPTLVGGGTDTPATPAPSTPAPSTPAPTDDSDSADGDAVGGIGGGDGNGGNTVKSDGDREGVSAGGTAGIVLGVLGVLLLGALFIRHSRNSIKGDSSQHHELKEVQSGDASQDLNAGVGIIVAGSAAEDEDSMNNLAGDGDHTRANHNHTTGGSMMALESQQQQQANNANARFGGEQQGDGSNILEPTDEYLADTTADAPKIARKSGNKNEPYTLIDATANGLPRVDSRNAMGDAPKLSKAAMAGAAGAAGALGVGAAAMIALNRRGDESEQDYDDDDSLTLGAGALSKQDSLALAPSSSTEQPPPPPPPLQSILRNSTVPPPPPPIIQNASSMTTAPMSNLQHQLAASSTLSSGEQKDELDRAIDAGDWDAAYVIASDLASIPNNDASSQASSDASHSDDSNDNDDDKSRGSRDFRGSPNTSMISGGSSVTSGGGRSHASLNPQDQQKAMQLDELIDAGDWHAVAALAQDFKQNKGKTDNGVSTAGAGGDFYGGSSIYDSPPQAQQKKKKRSLKDLFSRKSASGSAEDPTAMAHDLGGGGGGGDASDTNSVMTPMTSASGRIGAEPFMTDTTLGPLNTPGGESSVGGISTPGGGMSPAAAAAGAAAVGMAGTGAILGARQQERGYTTSDASSPTQGIDTPLSQSTHSNGTPVDPVLAASFEDLIEKNDWEGLAKLAGKEGSSIGTSGHSADSARLPQFTNQLPPDAAGGASGAEAGVLSPDSVNLKPTVVNEKSKPKQLRAKKSIHGAQKLIPFWEKVVEIKQKETEAPALGEMPSQSFDSGSDIFDNVSRGDDSGALSGGANSGGDPNRIQRQLAAQQAAAAEWQFAQASAASNNDEERSHARQQQRQQADISAQATAFALRAGHEDYNDNNKN